LDRLNELVSSYSGEEKKKQVFGGARLLLNKELAKHKVWATKTLIAIGDLTSTTYNIQQFGEHCDSTHSADEELVEVENNANSVNENLEALVSTVLGEFDWINDAILYV
jgi:hypothetical protein